MVSSAFAIECEWWQTKYSAAIVRKHPRKQTVVRKHPRKEYCREKWPNADYYIKSFKDKPEPNVELAEPTQIWNKTEIETILKILAEIPQTFEMENYHFYRSNKSKHPQNPASIDKLTRSIVLYDPFFTASNKPQILVHESGHYLFSKLPTKEKSEFAMASGWTKVIVNGSEVYLPPTKLIKDDSSDSQDEDFANYLELYLDDKASLKAKNQKVFDLFEKRFHK